MTAEPLIHWPDPIYELLGFIAIFLAAGAIGFRYAVLRRRLTTTLGDEGEMFARAGSRAAWFGFLGMVLGAALFVIQDLPEMAERQHTTMLGAVTGTPQAMAQVALMALALVGFALAARRIAVAWPLAAAGMIAGTLRGALFGQWARLVNPIHELAGGMWIGTLFVLVVAGLGSLFSSQVVPERRGVIAQQMVAAFSPFALFSAAVLATFGVITAWRHLHVLSNLWQTPYGITLIIKLCAVLGVVSLGAWNWRRQRPRMGTEAGARALRSSARAELTVAALVLVITSILVSLPSPRPPRNAAGGAREEGPPPGEGVPPADSTGK